ncbi:CBS domain-containing protein [Marinivivus vitaminiproducens]|uniref:CBS domain-containing protein n=1 Tax=Marinivivus vitaminiproducens TaxID=3035935 RepID=UPI0027A4D0AB|nr:CBS domain-containing protein [Geminicoccaceae bacterium SCSIO 64248]
MHIKAEDLMTREVVTVSPAMTRSEVARVLAKGGISAAPVIDSQGALVGMISEGDLLRSDTVARNERRSWWLEMLAEGEQLAPEFLEHLAYADGQVRDLMTKSVVAVDVATPLPEIALVLNQNRIKRVPVLEDGRMVGIVSRADLVRAMASG